MANIFSRNYKFDEPELTSTQDKDYFTAEVAYNDENDGLVALSSDVSTLKPKIMHCPDCGCPLILNNGELDFADEEDDDLYDSDDDLYETCVEYEEVNKDMFDLPPYYNICYGIPADLSLGSDTARRLDNYYHIVDKVSDKFDERCAGETIWIRNLFLLMIANKKYEPITMINLENCIKDLAQYCINEEISYLAMPFIGCGKGNLEWTDVRPMIIKVFVEAINEAKKIDAVNEDYKIHLAFCYQ